MSLQFSFLDNSVIVLQESIRSSSQRFFEGIQLILLSCLQFALCYSLKVLHHFYFGLSSLFGNTSERQLVVKLNGQ